MEWIAPSILAVLLGLVAWIIKSDTTNIRKRMDCFERSQHACQLDNLRVFATKEELQREKNALWRRVDEHGERLDDHNGRLSKLEAKQ